MATFAFVLHRRPFQESSAIIEFFTAEQGIVSAIARGVRRSRSRWYGALQPFLLSQIDWVGKSDLKTLTQVESQGLQPILSGMDIRIGLYLNELLLRLLQRGEPHLQIFEIYHETLIAIGAESDPKVQEIQLRRFELTVVAALGYGLDCNVEPDVLYCYEPDRGLIEASHLKEATMVSGATLIALRQGGMMTEEQRKEAKHLMRSVLSHYLGGKPLESRKLFIDK